MPKTEPETGSGARRLFKRGTAHKNGKLYRFDGSASSWGIEVIRPWPDPQAWRRSSGAEWRGDRPVIDLGVVERVELSLILPGDFAARRRHLEAAAFRAVPASVRQAIDGIQPQLQWPLLSLVGRVPGALDLLQSNPALATALAHPSWFGVRVKQPLRSARWLIRRPRRHIAAWLGLPANRSLVRMLGKIPKDSCHRDALSCFVRLARRPRKLRRLRHLPRINVTALWLLDSKIAAPVVTDELVRDITWYNTVGGSNFAANLSHALRGWREIHGDRSPPRLRSRRELQRLLIWVCSDAGRSTGLWGSFPEPPFPAQVIQPTDRIEIHPLIRHREIRDHGQSQQNCLDRERYYSLRCKEGLGYVYSVAWVQQGCPRRGTLYIERERPGGLWQIKELAGTAGCGVPGVINHAIWRFLWEEQRDPSDHPLIEDYEARRFVYP